MVHRLRRPFFMNNAKSAPAVKVAERRRDSRAGFSLIELLTVIAIIAILAAIIFPMAGTVRRNAQQAQVISNLHNVHQALGLYRQDEGGRYPVTLGPLEFGGSGVTTTYNGLFPEYVKDKGAYQSQANDADPNLTYPIDVSASARNVAFNAPPTVNDLVIQGADKAGFKGWDTVDGSVRGGKYVVHYSRYRTFDKNDPDYKRQLGFRNPPEDSVVTWNDTFVRYPDNSPGGTAPTGGEYLVLFLNGNVKKVNAKQAWSQTNGQIWRLQP